MSGELGLLDGSDGFVGFEHEALGGGPDLDAGIEADAIFPFFLAVL